MKLKVGDVLHLWFCRKMHVIFGYIVIVSVLTTWVKGTFNIHILSIKYIKYIKYYLVTSQWLLFGPVLLMS